VLNNWHNQPGLATWHGQTVPLSWPAGCASFPWPGCASQHGASVLDPWGFRAMLSDLFRGFKIASLALLSAKYRPSFCSFNKVLENTERCYMSKMYAKGHRFDPFLTWLNAKMREERSQIGAKIGLKQRFITRLCLSLACFQERLAHKAPKREINICPRSFSGKRWTINNPR